jgi:hypothetical protein
VKTLWWPFVEEANKRDEAGKFYTIASGMKAGLQPRTPICKERDNNLIGNGRLIMERWQQDFRETFNIEGRSNISRT